MKTTYKTFCARRGRDLETQVVSIMPSYLLLKMLKGKNNFGSKKIPK